MGESSLRDALNRRGATGDRGLRKLHPFYEAHPEAFPFSRLRDFTESARWPSGYAPTSFHGDYPKNREPGWSHGLQGVTHSDNYWYITQKESLWRFPRSHDLDAACDTPTSLFLGEDGGSVDFDYVRIGLGNNLTALGYGHMGDCDFVGNGDRGFVAIALEGGARPAVALIQFNGRSVLTSSGDFATLDLQESAPWCVVNDGTGILGFDMVMGRQMAHIPVLYQPTITVELSEALSAALRGAGLEALIPGGAVVEVVKYLFGKKKKIKFATFEKEELEGITIWDLNDDRAPGITGQIHLLMIDNYPPKELGNPNDLYFKHYCVTDPSEKMHL